MKIFGGLELAYMEHDGTVQVDHLCALTGPLFVSGSGGIAIGAVTKIIDDTVCRVAIAGFAHFDEYAHLAPMACVALDEAGLPGPAGNSGHGNMRHLGHGLFRMGR